MISIGMIGTGSIAPLHLNAIKLNSETTLTAVSDLVIERAEKAATPFGATVYTDYREMLQKEKLDAVIINLPHALHEECTIECAKHCVHILLEKPMSVSAESCRRMINACKEANVLLQIGHVQRYMPENRACRDIIESGELGDLVMINDMRTTNYFEPSRPKWFLSKKMAGGGIWMNYGAHALDKLCYLTGSRISSVTGSCTYYNPDCDVDGSAHVFARTESGITETITICGYAVVPIHKTMIYLTKGSLRMLNGEGLWKTTGDKYERVDTSKYPDPFAAQWEDFIEGVRSGKVNNCDGDYAADIIAHLESIWD